MDMKGFAPTDTEVEGWIDKPYETFLSENLSDYTKFIYEYTICTKNKNTVLQKMKGDSRYYYGTKTILKQFHHSDHAFAIATYVNNYMGWKEKYPLRRDKTNKIHRQIITRWTKARARKYLGMGWDEEGEKFYNRVKTYFQDLIENEDNKPFYEELDRSVHEYYRENYGSGNVAQKTITSKASGQSNAPAQTAAFDDLDTDGSDNDDDGDSSDDDSADDNGVEGENGERVIPGGSMTEEHGNFDENRSGGNNVNEDAQVEMA